MVVEIKIRHTTRSHGISLVAVILTVGFTSARKIPRLRSA
jgi:hypothetical protein